jgi:hypothetical protein
MNTAQRPVLSVVVAMVSDTTARRANARHLAECLEALRGQVAPPPMEIIVPYHDEVEGIDSLRARFPDVVFVAVSGLQRKIGSREHHDVLRARGLSVAKGDLLALLEDCAMPDPRWAASIAAAHQGSYAGIGGAIENGIDRALSWAVYFCDFARYQNPLPAGETAYASDANTSYKRHALEAIRAVWEPSFREVVVNGALISQGKKVALSPDIVVFQHRDELQLGSAMRERYVWGRSYALTRRASLSGPTRLIYAVLSPLLPFVLLFRAARTTFERRRHIGAFLRALPLTALLLSCWGLGEGMGYLWGGDGHGKTRARP